MSAPLLSIFSDFDIAYWFTLTLSLPSSPRRNPHDGQWHQQLGAVAHVQEARGGWSALPDGAAAPCHPGSRPAPTHHTDEVRRGLWLQGGIRGEYELSTRAPLSLPGHHARHCAPSSLSQPAVPMRAAGKSPGIPAMAPFPSGREMYY